MRISIVTFSAWVSFLKPKFQKMSSIRWHSLKTKAKGIRHHRRLVFIVSVSRMDSIGDRQDDLDKPENNEDNCHKMNNILF
jgi:hypothetical protein